jgi:hypothetical protein
MDINLSCWLRGWWKGVGGGRRECWIYITRSSEPLQTFATFCMVVLSCCWWNWGQYLRTSDQLLTSPQDDVCIQIGDTNKLLSFRIRLATFINSTNGVISYVQLQLYKIFSCFRLCSLFKVLFFLLPLLIFWWWLLPLCFEVVYYRYKFTRWFKNDRDKVWLVYKQIVPVIFEPLCILFYFLGPLK